MRNWTAFSLILASLLISRAAAAAETRHALVIGNQKYLAGALANPDKDAQDMAASLSGLGFKVTVVVDATLQQMTEAVSHYIETLQPGDVSFFFYSGHGTQMNDENFLIPVDFHATRADDIPYSAYSANHLLDALRAQALKLSIIVLDACRDALTQATRGARRGLTMMDPGEDTLIAYATGPGETADDGPPGQNGIFTGSILRYLQQPGLDVDDLFKRIREDVATRTRDRQRPWCSSNVAGAYYLRAPLPGAAATPELAATESPPGDERDLETNATHSGGEGAAGAPVLAPTDSPSGDARGPNAQAALDEVPESAARTPPQYTLAYQGVRHALVMAVGDYRAPWEHLDNPPRDAHDVSAKLRRLGFDVVEHTNPTKHEMDEATNDFIDSLRPGDVAVFYFWFS